MNNNFEMLSDMEVLFEVYLGEVNLSIKEIKKLQKGSVIDLMIPGGVNSNFLINKSLVGKGEIMVFEKNLAIRINDIFSKEEAIYHNGIAKLRGK